MVVVVVGMAEEGTTAGVIALGSVAAAAAAAGSVVVAVLGVEALGATEWEISAVASARSNGICPSCPYLKRFVLLGNLL